MASSAHNRPLSDVEIRVKALESLLVEKGLVDPAAVDALIDNYEHKVGPRNSPQSFDNGSKTGLLSESLRIEAILSRQCRIGAGFQ